MMPKPPIPRALHCLIQSPNGTPVAFTLDVFKALTLSTVVFGLFIAALTGTLFFFRELEVNRKLLEQLLELDLKLRLDPPSQSSSYRVMPPIASFRGRVPSSPAVKIVEEAAVSGSGESANSITEKIPTAKIADLTAEPPTDAQPPWSGIVAARLGGVSADCTLEDCTANLELLPSGTGIVQGELLMILETEVPRIGTGGPESTVRKQFILYPGFVTKEELNSAEISSFEKRPFKFSRTLNTSASFKIPKLLRPLALNVYLFDSNKTLTHHERKVIETE